MWWTCAKEVTRHGCEAGAFSAKAKGSAGGKALSAEELRERGNAFFRASAVAPWEAALRRRGALQGGEGLRRGHPGGRVGRPLLGEPRSGADGDAGRLRQGPVARGDAPPGGSRGLWSQALVVKLTGGDLRNESLLHELSERLEAEPSAGPEVHQGVAEMPRKACVEAYARLGQLHSMAAEAHEMA